jgi:hypothetical protein
MSVRSIRLCLAVLVLPVVLSYAGHGALAEKETLDVDDTVWESDGPIEISGSGVDNEKFDGNGLISFGPLAVPNVTGEFSLIVEFASELSGGEIKCGGQYALAKPGKPEFLVDRVALQEEFEGYYITDVDLKSKFKNQKGVEVLEVDLKVKLETCVFDSKGKVKCTKPKVTFKGTGVLAPS